MFAEIYFFFQAEDGIRDVAVTGVQTCALPISSGREVGQEGSIEAFGRANDDCEGAVRRNEQRGAPQGLLQKRLVAQHRAELLGPFVPDDSARQWAKPRAVSAGENESPGRRRVRL